MAIVFTSITLNTPNLENMLRFYEILGCDFQKSQVTMGSTFHRCKLQGVELSFISIKTAEKPITPKLMMGFKVQDLDGRMSKLTAVPGVIVILDPTLMPDGKKAIVYDPDGHSIELLDS